MAANVSPGYDASAFPAFAVTVDVVILTMVARACSTFSSSGVGRRRSRACGRSPGGFKRPDETLDEAARRELAEETGVDVPSLLTQFGAYGDPGTRPAHERRHGRVPRRPSRRRRDHRRHRRGARRARPRLGHPRGDGSSSRSTTCGIVRDAVERVRVELEVSGIATAFVGTTFTMAELRAVYEAIWGVQLDAANFRRSLVGEDGWVIPTGRTARPGPGGGRPAELYRAGRRMEARRPDPAQPTGGLTR